MGGTPFVPFKSNTLEPTKEEPIWAKMYYYFMYNRLTFMEHYHMRSNIESAYSMIKAKFGDSLRSKSDVGQINEALCKVLAHNIYVLVQATHELGIEPIFFVQKSVLYKKCPLEPIFCTTPASLIICAQPCVPPSRLRAHLPLTYGTSSSMSFIPSRSLPRSVTPLLTYKMLGFAKDALHQHRP